MEPSHCLAKTVSEQRGSKSWRLCVTKNGSRNKNLPKKPCFLDENSQKTRLKGFRRHPEVTWALRRGWGILPHTWGIFPADESRSKISQRAKQLKKNCSISKKYLGQTTYLQPSVTWNALNCFSRQSIGDHEAQISFLCNRIKSFRWSRRIIRKPIFWQSSAKNPWEQPLLVETCIKSHCCTRCLLCFSFQVLCITLRQAESATIWILQKICLKIRSFE